MASSNQLTKGNEALLVIIINHTINLSTINDTPLPIPIQHPTTMNNATSPNREDTNVTTPPR